MVAAHRRHRRGGGQKLKEAGLPVGYSVTDDRGPWHHFEGIIWRFCANV
jgi:hypothetical protein